MSRQETSEGAVFVVKDPRTRRFFRLREAEHFIASQLDGATSLDAVSQTVEARFGARVDRGQIEQFVERLRRLGLLKTEESASPRSSLLRVQGTILYLRFKAFDPNRLLDRLYPHVRRLFSPHFLILSALIVLWAFVITLLEWEAIVRDVRGLWRFDALLVAWVTVLAVTACHEFAHGLTCKHFGGEVREMGFMLIYFQPAFYCNVSDAWMFPERAKRLWVTFAGAYVETFVWGVATLTWRVVEAGTWVSFVALIVMATSAVKSFFNFNPLIKLDGYYLLSDYLEIPNLRQRAFSYLAGRIRRLWRRAQPDTAVLPARERRIFLLYGLLAGVYSYWLLGSIALAFGRYLVDRYQGFGAVLFGALVAVPFHGRITRLGGRVAAAAGTFTSRYVGRVARSGPGASRVKAVVASLLVLGAAWFGRMELTVSGELTVLPLHNADVRAEVEGLINQVSVDEGSHVKAGDLIATLSDADLRAELERTSADITQKQAELNRLVSGPRAEEIALGRSELQTAQTALTQLQVQARSAERVRAAALMKGNNAVEKAATQLTYTDRDLDRSRMLLGDGLISRQQAEQAQLDVEIRTRALEEARAELDALESDDLSEIRGDLAVAERRAAEARARLELLLAGTRREDIDVAEAVIAGLDARRRHLDTQIAHARIVSPTSGIVTTPRRKLEEMVGQHVNTGDLVAEVHALAMIVAEIAVAEWEAGDVRPNQRVRVRARAYPGVEFDGRVSTVAATVTPRDPGAREGQSPASSRDRVMLVTTTLDNASLRLKPGMNGYARISAGRRRIVDLLTRRLSSYIRTEFWSW